MLDGICTWLKSKKNCLQTFFATIIVGLFAHGYIFTHNIDLHDNTYNFYLGGTFSFGRWMNGIIGRLTEKATGELHYQTPLYLGILALFFVALSACIIADLLEIRTVTGRILLGGIFAAFPFMTALYSYMYTSASYMFGFLLGMIGLYLVCRVRKWYSFITGVILEACCVGTYQAFLPVLACITLLVMLKEYLKKEKIETFKSLILQALYFLGDICATVLVYLGIMKFFLSHYHEELTSYRGMNESVFTTFSDYISRAVTAYKTFFVPENGQANMFFAGLSKYHKALLVIVLILLVFSVCKLVCSKGKKWLPGLIGLIIVIAVFPLACNSVYLMCAEDVSSLMMAGSIGIFLLGFVLSEYLTEQPVKKPIEKGAFATSVVTYFLVAVMILLYCRFDNICYLKGEYLKASAQSYFTRLVGRIESTEGYDASYPVLFVGDSPFVDESMFLYREFGNVNIVPYSFGTIVNNYNWKEFMKSECGYDPVLADSSAIEHYSEVSSMGIYPNAGSIKVIDDTVVVRLR